MTPISIRTRPPQSSLGFTLIELVAVVIILAVLAAIALPKFIDMGRNARLAAIASMAGALRTTASNWQMVCRMNPQCSSEINLQSHEYFGPGGIFVNYNYEFVSGGGSIGGDQLDTLVKYNGFTASLPGGNLFLALDGAPDPTNRGVRYDSAYSTSVPHFVTFTTLTTGC